MDTKDDEMLYINFNQDATCLAVGYEKAFKIFNISPLKDNFEREMEGGIGIVEMLYKTNVLALVGGGNNPKYSPNKVVIWDDFNTKVISEFRFSSSVKNVKLKREKIFIILELKIYVFSFSNFQIVETLDTYENPKGIVAVSSDKTINIVAYPDKTKGYVRVKSYDKPINSLIAAHEAPIACISLNHDGSLVATASDKGTLIRIFRSDNGEFLQELRRGSEKAEIYCISFNNNSKFLACSSDRGTIHIFSLSTSNEKINKDNNDYTGVIDEDANGDTAKNQKSFLSIFKKILPLPKYFSSEWSFAQFRIPDLKSICAFGPNNTIYAVSADGVFYQGVFDCKTGGECHKVLEVKLTDVGK